MEPRGKSRRRYTAETRATVVADVKELGVGKAAKKHGVPASCVSRWHKGPAAGSENASSASEEARTELKPPPAKRKEAEGGSERCGERRDRAKVRVIEKKAIQPTIMPPAVPTWFWI
ncbi:MAG: transposase [Deltaproteobacteria bacterium]|nr:transposase [Deltaproteobacteria bacterium]